MQQNNYVEVLRGKLLDKHYLRDNLWFFKPTNKFQKSWDDLADPGIDGSVKWYKNETPSYNPLLYETYRVICQKQLLSMLRNKTFQDDSSTALR